MGFISNFNLSIWFCKQKFYVLEYWRNHLFPPKNLHQPNPQIRNLSVAVLVQAYKSPLIKILQKKQTVKNAFPSHTPTSIQHGDHNYNNKLYQHDTFTNPYTQRRTHIFYLHHHSRHQIHFHSSSQIRYNFTRFLILTNLPLFFFVCGPSKCKNRGDANAPSDHS